MIVHIIIAITPELVHNIDGFTQTKGHTQGERVGAFQGERGERKGVITLEHGKSYRLSDYQLMFVFPR